MRGLSPVFGDRLVDCCAGLHRKFYPCSLNSFCLSSEKEKNDFNVFETVEIMKCDGTVKRSNCLVRMRGMMHALAYALVQLWAG